MYLTRDQTPVILLPQPRVQPSISAGAGANALRHPSLITPLRPWYLRPFFLFARSPAALVGEGKSAFVGCVVFAISSLDSLVFFFPRCYVACVHRFALAPSLCSFFAPARFQSCLINSHPPHVSHPLHATTLHTPSTPLVQIRVSRSKKNKRNAEMRACNIRTRWMPVIREE
jgi:hypothetical protein